MMSTYYIADPRKYKWGNIPPLPSRGSGAQGTHDKRQFMMLWGLLGRLTSPVLASKEPHPTSPSPNLCPGLVTLAEGSLLTPLIPHFHPHPYKQLFEIS